MKAEDFSDKMKALSNDHESTAAEFKQELMEAYINEGIIEVYSPSEFLRLGLDYYTPFQLSCIIHQSSLSLGDEYLYIPNSGCYNEFKEADTYAELYDLIEGDDYIGELKGLVLNIIYSKVTTEFKA